MLRNQDEDTNISKFGVFTPIRKNPLVLAVLGTVTNAVSNPEIVKQLLDEGADPNIECYGGGLLSVYLSKDSQWTLVDYEVTKLLLEHGANTYYAASNQSALDVFLTIYGESTNHIEYVFSNRTQEEIDIRDKTLELLLSYGADSKSIKPEIFLDILKKIEKSRAYSLMKQYFITAQNRVNNTPADTYRQVFK